MAIGKEIKVVLALDDAGFSVKTKVATESVQILEKGLMSMAKMVTDAEKSLTSVTTGMKDFASGFATFNKALKDSVDGINKTVEGMNKLGAATQKNDEITKKSVTAQADARLKGLTTELEVNNKTIAAREQMLTQLQRLENDYRAKALAQQMAADALRAKKKAGSAREARTEENVANGYTNSAAVIRQEIAATESLIAQQRKEQEQRRANIATVEQEKRMIQSLADSNKAAVAAAANLGAQERMIIAETQAARLAADRLNGTSAQQAARTRIQAAREAAMEERRQAEAVGAMWKSMAQMYAGAKVEAGMKASVKDSDDYARTVERLDAMGVGGKVGRVQALQVSKQIQDSNPNMSKTDALKLTMSGVAGTVSTDPQTLGVIMPEIAKLMTVMNRQFPEQAHNLEDFGRNVMGVMEARGITGDSKKMMETLDNLARALTLSGGKMTVQDYETISRRGGVGNAPLKDSESVLWDIAAASQMKVMGGGGGAGGGGVSSFATMQKQAAKADQGGVLEKRSALENLVEFGVIDKDRLLEANGNKPLGRNAKPVPYVNADEAAKNMTKASMELVNMIKEKLAALPASDMRFFAPGADRNTDEAKTQAFGRFADQSFSNTSRAEFYKMLASEGSQERIKKEVQASKDAPDLDTTHEKAMKSWGVATDVTKASLEKLGVVVGDTLIPVLKPLLSEITEIIDGLTKFGENNPAAAQIISIAAASSGLLIGVKGFVGMFGMVTNLSTALGILSGATGRASTATSSLGGIQGVVNAITATGAKENLRAAVAQSEFAEMQLVSARATVANATGMARLTAVTTTLIPAQTAAAEATVALNVAQREAAVTTRLAGGAMSLLSGPLGVIVLGLTLGAAAWAAFGDAADSAMNKAKKASNDSAEDARNLLKRLQDETKVAKSGNANSPIIDNEKEELQKLRQKLADTEAEKKKSDDFLAARAAKGYAGPDAAAVNKITSSKSAALQDEITDLKKNIADRDAVLDGIDKNEAKRANRKAIQEREDEQKAEATNARMQAMMGKGVKMPGANVSDTDTVDTTGLFKDPAAKKPRAERDPLTRALEESAGKLQADQIKLRAILKDGETLDDLRKQAEAVIEGKRKGGDLSIDHDLNKIPAKDDPKVIQLKEQATQAALVAEQIKGVTFANERIAASTYEADQAMLRLANDGAPKTTDAMRALEREISRANQRLGAGTSGFAEWAKARDTALLGQARADVGNAAADLQPKNKADEVSLIPQARARQAEELRVAAETEDAKHDMLLRALDQANKDRLQSAYAAAQQDGPPTKAALDEIDEMNRAALATREAYETQYAARRVIRDKQNAIAMRTPIQSLMVEWQDTGKAIENIQANMANNLVSTLMTAFTTGKLNFRSFLASIVQELMSANIKKILADQFTVGGESGGGVLGFLTSAIGMGATALLGGGATVDYAGAVGGNTAGSGSVSNNLFANGGIMTDIGKVELRKYANGGVTSTPQAAIYGEGSTPEAYVPLPDGRSIPVSMKGGAGGGTGPVSIGISVNIDKSGTASTSTDSSDTGDWSKVAGKMKDMIQSTIADEQRPGGLLYK